MAMRILIDGYNLIAELWGMGGSRAERARQREKLLALLADYRGIKDHPMHVVFDGWREGDVAGGRDIHDGILVSYSPLTITADEVIRDLLETDAPGTLVVTSDKQITRWAHQAGADTVDSATFNRRLANARLLAAMDGLPDERDAASKSWDGTTIKKGNPHRRPKGERSRDRRLKKL